MAAKKKTTGPRYVLVTTQYRGVYYGRLTAYDEKERQCVLEDARMAIRWGTTNGVDELAVTGPTSSSKIGARAPKVWLPGLTSISDCTEAAVAAWSKVP